MSDLLLGTDPELVLMNADGLVGAQIYYAKQINNIHTSTPGAKNPEIGGDGHPYILEVRPEPQQSPVALAKEIRGIFERHKDDIPPEVAWVAGSFLEEKPIGGHIHFGCKALLPIQDEVVVSLHGLLAQIILLLEDPLEAKKRRSGQYGKLGADAIRPKPWGFEYRPLPSWVLSEPISIGVLALSKAIVLEQLNNDPQALINLRGSALNAVGSVNHQKFVNCDKDHFREKLPVLWRIVSRLRYFKTAEGRETWKYVALLYHIATKYETWYNDKDVLHRWGVRQTTPTGFHIRMKSKIKPSVILQNQVNPSEAWSLLTTANSTGAG